MDLHSPFSSAGIAPELTSRQNYLHLATYMGHVSIVSTAYYLQFVEPLAAAASARFAKHCGSLITLEPTSGVVR
jgi:hypothetical protein